MDIKQTRQNLLREWAAQTAWVGEAKGSGGYLTGYRVGRAKACERMAETIGTEVHSDWELAALLQELAIEVPRRDDDELDEWLVGWDAGHYDLRAELLAGLGGVAV